MDSIPKMKHWLETTPLTMGNWVSKAELNKELKSIHIEEVPIYETLNLETANEKLQKHGKLIAIGFDGLQIPRYQIEWFVD